MTDIRQDLPVADHGQVEPVFVHFDDLDSMGMLHNSRYAVLVERALGSYWHRLGYGYVDGRLGHVDASVAVAEFSIRYRRPFVGTGPAGVHFWTEDVGESTVVYGFRVVSADGATTHAEGNRVHVRFDPATRRSTGWQPETVAAYEQLRRPA